MSPICYFCEFLSLFLHVVRELLNFYEFPGDDIAIIKGSALAAATGGDPKIGKDAIMELMKAVSSTVLCVYCQRIICL